MAERCLVISASGIRLVYEIAVLKSMADHAHSERLKWKYLYGASGGALIAAFLSQYPVGEEKRAIEDLRKLVLDFYGQSGAQSYFPFGPVQGLLWNKSVYNPSMLYDLVEKNIVPERIRDSGRRLNIVVVGYSDVEARIYTEKDWKIIKDAVCASCSVPIAYPPKEVPDLTSPTGRIYCGDGGITDFFPLERAAENPDIGKIDAILSVGDTEGRVMDLAPKGQYPSLTQIVNAVLEGWYKFATDKAEKTVAELNMTVKNKKILAINPGFFDELPRKEKERVLALCDRTSRSTYVECCIFKPVTPLTLSASGIEDSVSQKLWDVGYSSAVFELERETGIPLFQRKFYV